MTPPKTIDRWVRPWGRYVPQLLIGVMTALMLFSMTRRLADRSTLIYAAAAIAIGALIPLSNRAALIRSVPLLLAGVLALRLPRRAQRMPGAGLWLALPFLAAIMTLSLP